MALILRRYAPDGACTESAVEGEITVGRATDNRVELPGLMVPLHALRLTPISGLRLRMECLNPAGITVNGQTGQRSAELVASDRFSVGTHELRLGYHEAAAQLILEVHVQDTRRAKARLAAITSLEQAGWRMRRPAAAAVLLVLALCVLAPLILRTLPPEVVASAWLPGDRLWSSGRLSDAHRHFGEDCGTCHESLFSKVRDETCLSCHAGIPHHGENATALMQARLDDRRCASCHFEHGGTHAVLPAHPDICAECHAEPARFASAKFGAVGDFEDGHPAFRVNFSELVDHRLQTQRAVLRPALRDHSGLRFPHELHLDAQGIRGAERKLEVLECSSCHNAGREGTGFWPMGFERHCQRCHELDVDLAGKRLRLPHGDSQEVRSLLETALGEPVPVLEPEPERRRPGDQADRGSEEEALDPVQDVFERRVCGKCHELETATPDAPAVRPPWLRQTWMPMAIFTHEPHRWVDCGTCHAAKTSTDADELMLPQIETCRACHGGVNSAHLIQSTCIDCHRFHQAESALMAAGRGSAGAAESIPSSIP